MRQVTMISDGMRRKLELLDLAKVEDIQLAMEPTGEPTDHHKVTASKMFGVPYDKVTAEMRKVGTQVNFGRMYR